MSDLLFEEYSKLPKEIQAQVRDYIEFLVTKYQERFEGKKPAEKQSNFGSAKGLIIMAEDFDDPLEDFKAYS